MGVRYHAKTELMLRLDSKDYSHDETITLKIPFALPYWIDSKTYERVDGEFQYKDEFYRLVEQKLEKDTLYIVCIKDLNEKKLFGAMSDYVKLTNELPASSQHTLKLIGSLMKDYIKRVQTEISLSQGWSREYTFAEPVCRLLRLPSPVNAPPPRCLG